MKKKYQVLALVCVTGKLLISVYHLHLCNTENKCISTFLTDEQVNNSLPFALFGAVAIIVFYIVLNRLFQEG